MRRQLLDLYLAAKFHPRRVLVLALMLGATGLASVSFWEWLWKPWPRQKTTWHETGVDG